MKPAPVNLPTIWRGCTYGKIYFAWKAQDGNPFNLAGWSARVETPKFGFNIVITAPTGTVSIDLTKDQTAVLGLGKEAWNWVWTGPDGTVYPPVLAGWVPIQEPKTKT